MIIRPVARPILRPIPRSPLDGSRGDVLTQAVKALFASGEKGVMFDFTRAENLYTDSARTTLVTASGDRIGSATDLSVNSKHASSAGTARPIFGSDTMFDALDDYMQTAAIDFSATDAVTVVASVRKLSDAGLSSVLEMTPNYNTNGHFGLFAPSFAGDVLGFGVRGTASSVVSQTGYPAPITCVVSGCADISSALALLRVNGVVAASTATSLGSGTLANAAISIGARAGTTGFLNGRIYRLLLIGRLLSGPEISMAERWAAQPVGITIP